MASCGFSTRKYSYDDVDANFNLTHFTLPFEDLQLKINRRENIATFCVLDFNNSASNATDWSQFETL
jgi:hypothetical protein